MRIELIRVSHQLFCCFEQETCLILEGNAVVKTPEETVEFGAGDYVVFPEGLKCTWEIKKKIRKHYKFG